MDVTTRLIGRFKELILNSTLVPGCRLPAEREFAARLGISRPSLRQALKVLEIMGVISQRVGDGTYLSLNAAGILNEPMEFLILMDGISAHELAEFRSVVEPEIAALAAERATTDDLNKLQDAIRRHENSADLRTSIDADLSFHQAIFDASGNRACSRIMSIINSSVWKTLSVTSQLVDSRKAVSRHKAIYEAIYKRDAAEARRLMQIHIQVSRQLLETAAVRSNVLEIDRLFPTSTAKTSPKPNGRRVAKVQTAGNNK